MRIGFAFPLGAVLAAAGVGLGAFGAHGLKELVEPAMLANWETGVRYHMYAALAMMVIGVLPGRPQKVAPWLLVAGIVLFGGSLYVMALTGARWLGAITPLGGVAIIVGLCLAAVTAWRTRSVAD